MSEMNLGDILRARREELGRSIENAVLATNIRARMLETFESSDYAHFPPSGYATGMLSSYARYLGLDPKEILNLYERENNAFQLAKDSKRTESERRLFGAKREPIESHAIEERLRAGETGEFDTAGDIPRATSAIKVVSRNEPGVRRASDSNRRSVYSTGRSTRSSRVGSTRRKPVGAHSAEAVAASNEPRQSQFKAYREAMKDRYEESGRPTAASSAGLATTGRLSSADVNRRVRQRDEEIEEARRRFAEDEERRSSAARKYSSALDENASVGESFEDTYGEPDYELRGGGRKRPSRRGAHSRSARSRKYSGTPDETLPQRIKSTILGMFSDKRGRIICIAVIFLVVAVIIAASLLIHTAGGNDDGVIAVGDGKQASENQSVDYDSSNNPVITVTTENGNPVEVNFKIKEGDNTHVQVTCDDNVCYDGVAIGAWNLDLQVTESLTATFYNPKVVEVTENGEKVDIPVGEDGTGSLTINVQATGLAADSSSKNS